MFKRWSRFLQKSTRFGSVTTNTNYRKYYIGSFRSHASVSDSESKFRPIALASIVAIYIRVLAMNCAEASQTIQIISSSSDVGETIWLVHLFSTLREF